MRQGSVKRQTVYTIERHAIPTVYGSKIKVNIQLIFISQMTVNRHDFDKKMFPLILK